MRIYRVKRHAVTQPLDPSYRLIPLTQGQNAIVDAADFEWLSEWNWRVCWDKKQNTRRAYRNTTNNQNVSMHVVIAKPKFGEEVDHRNHNTLDNRRQNLRCCTHTQNMKNTKIQRSNKSGFKGVHYAKRDRNWCAQIKVNGKGVNLGKFSSAEDAARAYDAAAKVHHGEFAFLNFPLPTSTAPL